MTAPVDEDVELIGGPKDGQQYTVHALPAVIVVPIPPDLTRLAPEDPTAWVRPTFGTARYRRDVISDRSHRWRYVYEGQG